MSTIIKMKHKPKKVRRESGRVYNKHYDPENGSYYTIQWNDWIDHRDGLRFGMDWDGEHTDKTKSIKVKRRQLNRRRQRAIASIA